MAVRRYDNFIEKNPYIEDLIKEAGLPLSDKSVYINGRLVHSLTEEEFNRLGVSENNIGIHQARKSLYYKNQIVVESGHTYENSGNKYEQKEFEFKEEGQYYIQASSAGGRGSDLNRFVGTWSIKDRSGVKDIDIITIYQQNDFRTETFNGEEYLYTWERTKDFEDKITTWKGRYTYLNNTIFLSILLRNGVTIRHETEDYGVLMLKRDIFVKEEIYKLYPWRIDDTIDDIEYKYVLDNTGEPKPPVLPESNTPDAKGADGQFFNEIISIPIGEKIVYEIGQGGQAQNTSGGDSQIINVISLTGGEPAPTFNDFGGRGGSFVYDYYGRIKYNKLWPEDGKLLLTYTGFFASSSYKLNVTKGNGIYDLSCPQKITPATIVTLKVKLENGYEIDYEKSTINEIYFKDFVDKIYVDNSLKDVKIELCENFFTPHLLVSPRRPGAGNYLFYFLRIKK